MDKAARQNSQDVAENYFIGHLSGVSRIQSGRSGFLNSFAARIISGRRPTCLLTKVFLGQTPSQTIEVVVQNGYYFERYFLDYQSGQVALTPDITPIVSSLVSNLAKLQLPGAARLTPDCSPSTIASVPPTSSTEGVYRQCFANFAVSAKGIYLTLEPAVFPDSRSNEITALAGSNLAIDTLLKSQVQPINDAYAREAALSANIGAALKTASGQDLVMLQGLSALSSIADAIAKDLFAYGQHISDLPTPPSATQADMTLNPIPDPQAPNPRMVTRQVTYALTALNLVQNSRDAIPATSAKKTIVTVTMLFGDFRWEGSAGSIFSTLAIRSFSVAPIISNGMVTNKQVSESVLHPSVVPFAAASYRLSDDWRVSRWRMACYWTFGAGGNPNTVSADFATGPSISWRGLMFSGLWHLGHDVRATQGLYKNEPLGATYSGSITTQNYWRFDRVALGISVRIPALTGR